MRGSCKTPSRDISTLLDAYDRLLQAVRKDAVTDELLAEMEAKLRSADLDYLTAEIPQAIQQSLEGVEHVAGIVGAMKEFAHPDAKQKQAVDLNHVIKGAITLCGNEWKYVAEVVTDFDPDLPPVCCLPSDINRVVLNLVVNAAHAMAEASHNGADGKRDITVRTRRDGPWAEIRVEDSGAGIPEEIRDRVFEPFFTTKEVGRGTGQGLAIVHAIVVEKHGGTIRFQSRSRPRHFVHRPAAHRWAARRKLVWQLHVHPVNARGSAAAAASLKTCVRGPLSLRERAWVRAVVAKTLYPNPHFTRVVRSAG